jgi:hypothetical protein
MAQLYFTTIHVHLPHKKIRCPSSASASRVSLFTPGWIDLIYWHPSIPHNLECLNASKLIVS